MSALPQSRRPERPRGSAQPSPVFGRRRERCHRSVHGRKGPEDAGPRGKSGVGRGTGPRRTRPRALEAGGPARLGSAARARAGAMRGGGEEATRARGGGAARREEERGGRVGRAAAGPPRSTRLAASAQRPPPPARSLPVRRLASPGRRVAVRRHTVAALGWASLRGLALTCRAGLRGPGPAPRAPCLAARTRPPPAHLAPPAGLLAPRPPGSAAPRAPHWQGRAGPARREGAFKATHTPPSTERERGAGFSPPR